jgi:hypothetical protein
MIVEFSKYMGPIELDVCLEFLEKISDSKIEANWTQEDAASQMKIMLGEERYVQLKHDWSKNNQHLLKNLGQKKYLGKDGVYYDGLDPEDNPQEFQEIYI